MFFLLLSEYADQTGQVLRHTEICFCAIFTSVYVLILCIKGHKKLLIIVYRVSNHSNKAYELKITVFRLY
jgi:hypothetical protein